MKNPTLATYRTKRRLALSPEPPARRGRSGAALRFVVQKHWARRLHYDFRLESGGVLKSWAVPKGFSLDPRVKRLAIQVEDHPYAYRDFEGRIPEGQYGAGRVIIWDEGAYTPGTGGPGGSGTARQRAAAGLAKGHLDFTLLGTKLRGGFTLVRMKSTPNQWLLIKKRDAFASADAVLNEGPVRSGGKGRNSLPGRSGKRPGRRGGRAPAEPALLAGLDLSGAPKRRVPAALAPMLATLIAAPFDAENWIFEAKYDGYRSRAEINHGRVRLFSRANLLQNRRFPKVAAALRTLGVDAVLDGEIVAVDENGRADFQALQRYLQQGEGEVIYYVFDVLSAAGRDLRPLPLRLRRAVLSRVLPASDVIRESVAVEKSGRAFYRAALANGLEGMVAKNLDSPYLAGVRSREWLKIKAHRQQEAVICGFTEPRVPGRPFGALILGVYRERELVFAGHVGTGFDEQGLAMLARKLKPFIAGKCPFVRVPETNMPVTWLKPGLVAEIKFEEWTRDGSMRQPVFLGLREDLRPAAAARELPADIAPGEPEALPVRQTRARFTNLDKVLWPREGYTKRDLILYYDRISERLLPFLKNRPQSLNRHPNGISEPGFFQKNIETDPPAWVKTARIFSDHLGQELRYLVCQNRDTLLYLANLGCVELNVWNSTLAHLEKPDFLVLDFDPMRPGFSHVVKAALAMKQLLDQIGLPGFVKTSGLRGLHVYVPVQPRLGHEQVRDFAHLLASIIARRHPGLLARERDPGQRRGLVYLDYPQNRYGATMAAPYALRPRAGAPASAPLAWNEVTPALNPAVFNIRTLPERLSRQEDPWERIFERRADLAGAFPEVEKILAGQK